MERITRRRFGSITGSALAGLAFGSACRYTEARAEDGRLTARPRAGVKAGFAPPAPGARPLGLADGRDALLQLPEKPARAPVPLLVLLHGAGGTGANILRRLGAIAEETGIAVLAPDSREGTWDAIRGDPGPDVRFLDRALRRVFDTVAVDPECVSVGGFSDGATYALTLGLINGDLFRRVVAFSPGFYVEGPRHGKARFFVSHGTSDPILPIERCSRVIVPRLQKGGYQVTYREFDGGHTMPSAIAREGMRFVSERAS